MALRTDFDEIMRQALGLEADADLSTVAYGQTPEWDSVAHLQLITAVEDAYGIRIDGADVLGTADYHRLKTLLSESYGVTFDD